MLKKVNQIFKNNIIGTQNLIRYYYFNRLFKLFFANKKSEFYSLIHSLRKSCLFEPLQEYQGLRGFYQDKYHKH